MKKICMQKVAVLMAVAALTPMAGHADNGPLTSGPSMVAPMESGASLSITDFTVKPGETATCAVNLTGMDAPFDDGYRGYQFDLVGLPQEITIGTPVVPFDGWQVPAPAIVDGAVRVMAYTGDAGTPEKATEIMNLEFRVAPGCPEGSYTVNINTVDFSSPKGVDIYCADSSFIITVKEEETPPVTPPDDMMVIPGMSASGGNYYQQGELSYVVESGTEVNMFVTYSGGDPDGWAFAWTEGGDPAVLGTSSELDVKTENPNVEPLLLTYTIHVTNTWEGQEIYASDFTYTIEVFRKGELGNKPDQEHQGWIPGPDDNGTYIYGQYGDYNGSVLRIREGNTLSFYVQPLGGYYPAGSPIVNNWQYLWQAPDGTTLGTTQEIETPAALYPAYTTIYGTAAAASDREATSDNTYYVTVTNNGPDGTVWTEMTLPTAKVEVYKRPQAPTQLLRKGEGNKEVGTSHTFVVMMTPLDNQEILDLGYTYTYGYTDQNGVMHELETTDKRYTHTTSDIYWNSSYKFWAYSNWTYPDGSVITSGLRYLSATADSQGAEDYSFDASVFSGTRGESFSNGTNGVDDVTAAGEDTVTAIYTTDGRYVGTDPDALPRGLYIIKTTNSAKKVIL